MLAPTVEPWMKETHSRARVAIDAVDVIAFENVARPARERAVGIDIAAATRWWDHVLHFEWRIEHDLRGMTIFTAMSGPRGNGGIMWIHARCS
jgi:hypothetical protein